MTFRQCSGYRCSESEQSASGKARLNLSSQSAIAGRRHCRHSQGQIGDWWPNDYSHHRVAGSPSKLIFVSEQEYLPYATKSAKVSGKRCRDEQSGS
jgi:hypothetical protein